MYKTLFLFSFISIAAVSVFAQRQPDQVFNPAIKTILRIFDTLELDLIVVSAKPTVNQ